MKSLWSLRAAVLALAVVLTALVTPTWAYDHEHDEHFDRCAKACADCQRMCDSCYRHCADLVAGGNKDHARSMNLCLDCGEVCSTAAKLSARKSTLAGPTCEACARVCDVCAEECEKFKDDKHMTACARECRACAKECRAMLKHIK